MEMIFFLLTDVFFLLTEGPEATRRSGPSIAISSMLPLPSIASAADWRAYGLMGWKARADELH
jgi:hypothetical protein